MTVSFEEYKQSLDNYVTQRGHTFVPFQYPISRYDLYYSYIRGDTQWAQERSYGMSKEEMIAKLYEESILGVPYDVSYNIIHIGDEVVTKFGLIGVVERISPKRYITLKIKGSDRITKRKAEVLVVLPRRE